MPLLPKPNCGYDGDPPESALISEKAIPVPDLQATPIESPPTPSQLPVIGTQLDELPKPKELMALGKRWRPYRSVACWYLWRAAEMKGLPEPGAKAKGEAKAKQVAKKKGAGKPRAKKAAQARNKK